MAGMQLRIQRDNEKVVIHLKGTLDGSTACQVEHVLQRLQKISKGCRLVFDLGRLRSFEYFGVAIFAKSIRSQKNYFQEISFTGLQTSTQNLFRSFGLESTPTG